MKTICIVHFQPIENYPPTFNLVRLLRNKTQDANIEVITTGYVSKTRQMQIPGVSIHRVVTWKNEMSRVYRTLLYIFFNVKSFLLLLGKRPFSVLYYESLSAGPVYLYTRIFSTRLFIHYHEYTSPQEYMKGMVLNRWLHKLEFKMYQEACWVSHTNEDRSRMFLEDCSTYSPVNNFIVPNYPPADWQHRLSVAKQSSGKTGFVYVGALDTETMYFREMALLVAANSEDCYWDIYSDNFSPDCIHFLHQLNPPNINFKGAIDYDSLSLLLPGYDVGLILYKGHIPNYIYNAPNKLFEYAVCGLDVWFPDIMVGCRPYLTHRTWPKIIAVDFNSMDNAKMQQLVDRTDYMHKPHDFSCEAAFASFVEKLTE